MNIKETNLEIEKLKKNYDEMIIILTKIDHENWQI